MYYNSEDGRYWKHEYEMLSLVVSKYQDMTDAHAAPSESGSSALVVEQRRMFAKQISHQKENIAFLFEQLATWFADESMNSIRFYRFRHQRICSGQLLTVVLCLSGISNHIFINCNCAVICRHLIVAAALVASAIVVTLKFVEVKGEQGMLLHEMDSQAVYF